MTAQPPTRILVIETAAPLGGWLYAERRPGDDDHDDESAGGFEVRAEYRFTEPHQHAKLLVPTMRERLPVAPREIELLLVDRGPGSHTGTRIGLAVAKMLAWQARIPARGVISLDALASDAAKSGQVTTSEIVAVLPCRSGLVYARHYRYEATTTEKVLLPQPLTEPQLIDVHTELPSTWHDQTLVGDALTQEPTLAAAAQEKRIRTHDQPWPKPESLLRLAPHEPSSAAPETLTPLYLAPITAKTLTERRAAGIRR